MNSNRVLLFCILFGAFGCDNENVRKETIGQKINERIIAFKQRTIAGCELRALEKAAKMADSILLANVDLWQIQTDPGTRPTLPLKPTPPAIKIRVDSSKVEPLFPLSGNLKKESGY